MTEHEALQCVDTGADFYLRAMGDAEHMEIIDNGVYEIMRSRSAVNDLASVYNMRLEALPDAALADTIAEIRALGIHTWWPLSASDRVAQAIHGRRPRYAADDIEIYGIMQPSELPAFPEAPPFLRIVRVETAGDFATWCELDNTTEHGGSVIFYPPNHMHLIAHEKLIAFVGYCGSEPIATSAVLDDGGIASLEFVCTAPSHRMRGIATAMCRHALTHAFAAGAKVVTTRGIADGRALVKSLGFRVITR